MRLGVVSMTQVLGRVVIAHRTPKTIRVCVDNFKLHPVLKKYYIDKKLLMVHDEKEETMVGDLVMIGQRHGETFTSKRKTYKVLHIIEKMTREQIDVVDNDVLSTDDILDELESTGEEKTEA